MTAVIEGEVISTEVAVLPPDVQTKVAELRPLDGPAQAARVTAMPTAVVERSSRIVWPEPIEKEAA